ncbi:unnamed protein product [Caenorhabditis auriculariae]|uniref:Uncharacterized protein n=1 Tax=Caenorhabditis auriculariae TaxID=2777116 RepID=A0A8S1HAC6_9PELO|nr:unnamed protein product [Caenorhabditis auriculariae]
MSISLSKEREAALPPVVEEPTTLASDRKIRDSSNLAYYLILLQGIGILMPWNMFLNISYDYYINHKLLEPVFDPETNTTVLKQAEYSNNFQIAMTLSSQVPNLLLNLINMFVNAKGDLTFRINACLSIISSVVVITIALIFVETENHMGKFFYFTLFTIIILNGANGVFQNSMFGLVSDFPFKYTNAVIIGQNFCGTLITIIGMLTKAAASTVETRAVAYFTISLAVLISCLVSIQVLKRLPFYRFYTQKKEEMVDLRSIRMLERDVQKTTSDGATETERVELVEIEAVEERSTWETYLETFKEAKGQLFNIFFLFFVTLAIFPNIQTKITDNGKNEPYNFIVSEKYFMDVTTFLNFNLFAFIGSMIANYVQIFGPRNIWIPVVVRALWLFYFPFCNYDVVKRNLRVLFPSTWLYVINGSLMALSSGYLTCLIMMYAPRSVKPDRSRIAGMMAGFFLILGIVCGLAFSEVINHLVR